MTDTVEIVRERPWWNFAEVAEAEELYGSDESVPWFQWRPSSVIWLADGSSRWVDVEEPVIAQNRYDGRDAYSGTSYTKLPASQRYGLRVARWQEQREAEFARWIAYVSDWNVASEEPF